MNSPIELLEILGEFWEVSAAVCLGGDICTDPLLVDNIRNISIYYIYVPYLFIYMDAFCRIHIDA